MSNFDSSKYADKLNNQQTTENSVAETVTETKQEVPSQTETAEVKTELPQNIEKSEKQEVKTETVKSETKEKDKPWYEKDDYVVEPSNKQEVSEAELLKKQLLEAEARIKEYQSDPTVLAIIDAKKSGKEVTEVLKDIIGVDYDKMSSEEIYTLDLKKKGFNDEEIQEALELFNEKSNVQKKLETINLKESFKAEQKAKLSQYENKVQSQEATPQENPRERNIKKAESDLETLSSLDGKEYLGVTLTKDIIESVKDAINNKFVIGDEDNGFDINASFDHHFKAMYTPLIVKANVQKAKTETKEAALNEITRPDKNISERAGTEQIKDSREETRGTIKNIWNR
jgi:hypothetical protein